MSDVPVILVANRGEIAMRIIAAARRIGASPVLAASVADKDSPAARAADRVIVIGASPANQSYLKPEQVAQAAVMAGAAAVPQRHGALLTEFVVDANACHPGFDGSRVLARSRHMGMCNGVCVTLGTTACS